MESHDRRSIPDDEIDLEKLGARIRGWVLYPFFLWRTYPKTTLLFIITAVILCTGLKYALPKIYRSSFIIRPIDKTEKFHLNVLGDLQLLLRLQDHATVGQLLGLRSDQASAIAGISASNLYFKNRTDSINNTIVTISTTDHNQLTAIQNGILNYLESHPYFLKIKEMQKRHVSQAMEVVEADLSRLEELKKLQIENYGKMAAGAQSPIMINNLVNPTAMYAMTSELMNKKLALQSQLVFIDNFQLVKGVVVVKQHAWPPRILEMCLYIVPLFMVLALFFLHYRHRRSLPAN